MAALLQVCEDEWGSDKHHWFIPDQPENYITLLKDMILNRSHTLRQCSFQGVEYPCDMLLTETITSLGVCYTFNNLPASDIYRDIV